jgi:periplasmic divalent cation tolerance protein
MTTALVVFCTCPTREEAARIANDLVGSGIAACVNILPGVESVYRWEGTVERAQEILLLVKTTERQFASLRNRIDEIHSYEVPEIIALPVVSGSEPYLTWLQEQVLP